MKKYYKSLFIFLSVFFIGLLTSCLEPVVTHKYIYLDGSNGGTEAEKKYSEPYVLECRADYDNFIEIPYIPEGSGYTTINAELKWESLDGIQAAFQLMSGDNENMRQASSTVNFGKEFAVASGPCLDGALYTDWSTGSAKNANCADSASKLQFYIQDSTYFATSGFIYIKNIWLSGPGKKDKVLFSTDQYYLQNQGLSIKTTLSTYSNTNNDVVINVYTSKTNISRIGYVYSEYYNDFYNAISILDNNNFIRAEKYGDGVYRINASVNGYYFIAAQDTDGYSKFVVQSVSNIYKTTNGPNDAIRNWVPGTTSTQWSVYNFDDLKKLAEIVNGGNNLAGVTITQKENITINPSVLGNEFIEPEEAAEGEPNDELINFSGIGSRDNPFAGTYNGNGKRISGLYIYGAQQGLGFFGGLSGATIKNVIILDGCVVNKNTWESVDLNNALTHDGSDDDRFGGLVGMLVKNGGENTVENCLFVGTVGSQAAKDRGGAYEYIGGIIGRVEQGSTANLQNCYSLVRLYGSAAALVKKVSGTLNCTDCIGVSLDGKVYKTQEAEELTLDEEGGVTKTEIINAAKTACGIDLTEYFVRAGL